MSFKKIGSVDYFRDVFGDAISSITDEGMIVDNAIIGFILAMEEQQAYHQDAVEKLRKFRTALSHKL